MRLCLWGQLAHPVPDSSRATPTSPACPGPCGAGTTLHLSVLVREHLLLQFVQIRVYQVQGHLIGIKFKSKGSLVFQVYSKVGSLDWCFLQALALKLFTTFGNLCPPNEIWQRLAHSKTWWWLFWFHINPNSIWNLWTFCGFPLWLFLGQTDGIHWWRKTEHALWKEDLVWFGFCAE